MAAPETVDQTLDALFSSISCAVLGAGQVRLSTRGRMTRGPEAHYRLYVCLSGRADFVVHGQTYHLAPGGVILVPPGAAHEAHRDSAAPLTALVVDFTARLHGIIDVPAFCGFPVAVTPSVLRRPKMVQSAQAIVRHVTYHIPGYQLAVHTHCVRLLDLLWKETLAARPIARESIHSLAEPAKNPSGVRALELLRLGPALRLVEERYAERLTLAALAGTMHLHPAYFSALFRRVTGMPPLRYLARYRVERARDLLLATDRSLEDIAFATGFCDAAHLIRVFHRSEGVSPGRYRRSFAA